MSRAVDGIGTTAHPRSRGENMVSDGKVSLEDGSSPLTRGKLPGENDPRAGSGLIPAHAGKTTRAGPPRLSTPAHPRSRGENHRLAAGIEDAGGSSPLTRGKPMSVWGSGDKRVAHPRSRGENGLTIFERLPSSGSSPLTRGKP